MDRIIKFWRNLSIRKTLMIYTLVFMVLATILSSATINLLERWQGSVTRNYYKYEETPFSSASGKKIVINIATNTEEVEYSTKDKIALAVISFFSTAAIPIFFGGSIILAAILFYRHKLKKPIELINQSAVKIAEHNLDFSLRYDSNDEMGRLCASLETMRVSLENNNREMWRLMEERKRLNAAFSHDLRTPLTVLRGYSDFLSKYAPQGKVTEDKLLSTVSAISRHTARLESYVETMNDVQRWEDISIATEETSNRDLFEQIASIAEILERESTIKVDVTNRMEDEYILVDTKIVLRVIENLLSNALRYAKMKILVNLEVVGSYLIIEVLNDGNGFSPEDLKQATKAFYRDQSGDHKHFGLGLYICKSFCEKHGGDLGLLSEENGGAKVRAAFLCTS